MTTTTTVARYEAASGRRYHGEARLYGRRSDVVQVGEGRSVNPLAGGEMAHTSAGPVRTDALVIEVPS